MTTTVATHHFTGQLAALAHYNRNEGGGYSVQDIRDKIAEGAIVIGPPVCKHDGTEAYYAKDGRYYIIRADDRDEGSSRRYKVKRFKLRGKARTLHSGLTRVEAEAHCEGDSTSGPGWFDGFTDK
jgi:hypothetical protein